MVSHPRVWGAVLAALALSAPAAGQPPTESHQWSHGTTINGFLGGAVDGSASGLAAGGAVGWEITPRVALEGSASWFDRGLGADAFAASLKAQVTLARPLAAEPFLQAGVGLYRASFDPMRSEIPAFYQHRMGNGRSVHSSRFTDPTLVFGGGANVFLSRHVAIRPDVETILVMRHARVHVVTALAVHLAVHFEEHPVTPRVGSDLNFRSKPRR